MSSASSSSSMAILMQSPPLWLAELWAAATNAAKPKFGSSKPAPFRPAQHCPILYRIVHGVLRCTLTNNGGRLELSWPTPVLQLDTSGMDSTNPAQLIQRAILRAEMVLSEVEPSKRWDLPECLFQFLVFLIMRTYEPKVDPHTQQTIVPDALRFSMVRMEAKCKRLHSQKDECINLSPTYSPGSPNSDNETDAGSADLICSIANMNGAVRANYVLELKSVRPRYLKAAPTHKEIDKMSTDELMQLQLGDRDHHRDVDGVTHVRHVVASALHQSCSYHSIEVDGKVWPPTDSFLQCLAVVAMGHRVLVSDTECVGVDSYLQWQIPDLSKLKESLAALDTASSLVKEASVPKAAASVSAASSSSAASAIPASSQVVSSMYDANYALQSAALLREAADEMKRLANQMMSTANQLTDAGLLHAAARIKQLTTENEILQSALTREKEVVANNDPVVQAVETLKYLKASGKSYAVPACKLILKFHNTSERKVDNTLLDAVWKNYHHLWKLGMSKSDFAEAVMEAHQAKPVSLWTAMDEAAKATAAAAAAEQMDNLKLADQTA